MVAVVPDVEVTREGAVLTITLNRPDVLNALNKAVHDGLHDALELAKDPSVRAVVITGAGRGFCVGQDLQEFSSGAGTVADNLRSNYHRNVLAIRALEKPVIAAVNGPAAGAGFSLALACDIRIAAENAFFAPAYGRIGASPDGGMTYFLPRVVGPSRALEILLADPNMSAADALAERLVSEVVPGEELMDRVQERAEKLAAMAPHYVRMAKLLTGQSIENSLSDHLQLERHGIADSMGTEDLRSGVQAFFAGEKPEFEGR